MGEVNDRVVKKRVNDGDRFVEGRVNDGVAVLLSGKGLIDRVVVLLSGGHERSSCKRA